MEHILWHRCRRWWRIGILCPFSSMDVHEDDEEEGDPEGIKVPVPGRRKVDKDQTRVDRNVTKVGENISDEELKELGEAQKIRERAEEIVKDIPRPIPRILEPVGDIIELLHPRGSGNRPRREFLSIVGIGPLVERLAPSQVVALAAAIVMNRIGNTLPAAAQFAPQVIKALKVGDKPRVPVITARSQLPFMDIEPVAISEVVVAASEEAVAQELSGAPLVGPPGFGFKARRVGLIVGGAAAVAGAVGGGRFLFNSAQRLRALRTGGLAP